MLLLGVALSAWMLAGAAGVGYIGLFLAACAPGLPLGFMLFGRSHPVGWLAGLLFGYATTTLSIWTAVFTGHPGVLVDVLLWAAAFVTTIGLSRFVAAPVIKLPPFGNRARVAAALLLLLVPLLVTRPFNRLGDIDAEGNRQYRAYFIADFFWHAALTAELARETPRPHNPYLAEEPLHYYWTYFRTPATLSAHSGISVPRTLKMNALLTALLLVAAIYAAAWAALPEWPLVTAAATALTILAPSIEGWAGIADIIRRGLPLSELRDLNIDALAAWAFKGLRIDNLPRTFWYTPQHGFSCALGLLALPAAITSGAAMPIAGALLSGVALAGSVAFNPLLGACFCAIYGITILVDVVTRARGLRALVTPAAAVVPVLIALGWCAVNQVGEGASGVLHFGFWGLAKNATLVTFLLQFGPLLLPMALGAFAASRSSWTPVVAASAGFVVAVLVMHLIALTVDTAWVGFRGGNILLVTAPALVARGLIWARQQYSLRTAALIAVTVLAAGLPTTAIDAFNAQDVENRGLSRDAERARGANVAFDVNQEFHWTVITTAAEQEAFDWIREHTPATAVVQMEPTIRGRETWSLIPTFAERRLGSGVALPLLARPIYDERNARIRRIYESADADAAYADARALGIDFLYVDRTEREAFPNVAKFDKAPAHFDPVFRNEEVVVYAVRP